MPALSTLSSRLRDRIPHLSCAIIKSGTSRFVVLREEELPTRAPAEKSSWTYWPMPSQRTE